VGAEAEGVSRRTAVGALYNDAVLEVRFRDAADAS